MTTRTFKKPGWYSSAIRALAILTIGALATGSALGQGLAQSPIDILATDLVVDDSLPFLHFTYGDDVTLDVVNTGSPDEFASIRANVPAGAGRLRVAGVTYHLLQFHWHTPSEHLLEGRGFPLEMHLVHQADDGSLLVVAIFISQGAKNAALDKVFSYLPATAGGSTTVRGFDLDKLLPGDRESFRYTGSLTTPPFTEPVQFVVLAEASTMSRHQLQAFQDLFPEGNSREPQPLNGRTVLTDIDPEDH
jgi:carbonic anhydrase